MRIKEEIRKILKGETDETRANMRRGTQLVQKKRRKSVIDKKNEQVDEEEEEANELVTVVAEEVEVQQFLQRCKLLKEVVTYLLSQKI